MKITRVKTIGPKRPVRLVDSRIGCGCSYTEDAITSFTVTGHGADGYTYAVELTPADFTDVVKMLAGIPSGRDIMRRALAAKEG